MSSAVDHAVVNVLYEMDDAIERFRSMGFTLTARGYHSLGSINHLMMFGRDYLELVGIERGVGKVRQEIAESPPGLNGLVFKADDAAHLHDVMQGRGIPVLPPVDFDRPVELDGRTETAAFRTFRIDPAWLAGGRVYFCEHKTPQLVWQPQWQRHDNAAAALAGFSFVVAEPADEAARMASLLDLHAQAAEGGDARLDVGSFRIVWCTADSYRHRYGSFGCRDSQLDPPRSTSRTARMGALAIRTGSLDRLRECLRRPAAKDIDWRDVGDRVTVSAASAYGCAIEFVS